MSKGYPEPVAGFLVGVVHGSLEKGSEEAWWNKRANEESGQAEYVVLGKEPLKEWIERHKELFVKGA